MIHLDSVPTLWCLWLAVFSQLGKAEGNGFKLIGHLTIFNPPHEDMKQTIDDALALSVKVKIVTGDQLACLKGYTCDTLIVYSS